MSRSVAFVGLFLVGCLNAQSPTLENILLFGNTRTKSPIILRELDIQRDAPVTESILTVERTWLLRQDFLKRIEFQIAPGSTEMRRSLILVVQEKGYTSVSPILTSHDVYGWYAGTRLTLRNALGYRNRFDLTAQVGGYRKLEFAWSNPWIGRKLRLFTDLKISYAGFRYRFDDTPSHFDETDLGVHLALGRRMSRTLGIGIQGSAEQIWTGDTWATVSSGHTDEILSIGPFIQFDSRDWPLYPERGAFIQASCHVLHLQHAYRFYQGFIDARFYFPVFDDNIFAVQSLINLSRGTVPVYKRIHLGGGSTLRGYSAGELSGENSLLVSAEYRLPIFYIRNPLAGVHVGYAAVLFTDIAATWDQDPTWENQVLHAAYGLGFHFIWDHWIVRAEYGYRGRGYGFINLGTGIKF